MLANNPGEVAPLHWSLDLIMDKKNTNFKINQVYLVIKFFNDQ